MQRWGFWIWVGLVLLVGGGAPGRGQLATLSADAHVNQALPAVNSGAISNINVGGGYTGLLQFDLSLLPAGTTSAQISRAVLRVYVNQVNTAGVVSVQPLNANWAEYGVTFSTLPALGSVAAAVPVNGVGYVAVDVTPTVQGWVTAPASNHGVALTAGTASIALDSKENDLTGHPAVLEIGIVSQGPAGPAGPSGAPGAAGQAGAIGPAGPAGPAGLTGPAGATGAQGPVGPHGSSGFVYQGAYDSTANYTTSDVVLFQGSSYISLMTGNHGNTPGFVPSAWGLLASGATGSTTTTGGTTTVASTYQGTYSSTVNYALSDIVLYAGSSYLSLRAGNHGNTPDVSGTYWGLLAFGGQGIGPQGPAGPAGAQGAQGLPGLGFEGAYQSTVNYGLDDVVSFGGSSYISQITSNHGNTPGQVPGTWALLAAAGIGTTGATGAVGPTGPQGPPGLTGAVGIAGPQGATGAIGPRGLPGLVYQGAYASTTNYALGDVVLWQGASWASLMDGNHGNTPSFSPSQWGVLTQQGPMGATGATGAAGPTGATGALGPVGPPGERGDQGLQGIAGQAGAQGIPGVAGAVGPSGPAGPQGVAGPVGLTFQGVYSSATNYALADGVSYNGAGYVSLVANNHGNTPDQSPAQWTQISAAGTPGAKGAPGLVYQGAYASATNYALGDVVLWQGASWASLGDGNHGNTPSASPEQWGLLTAQGPAGAAGAAGPAGPTGATGALGPVGPPGEKGDQGAQGIAGQAGAQGIAGAAGATGPSGPAGPQGIAGPVGLSFQGTYSSATNYNLADGVQYNGAGYVSLVAGNHGNTPDASPAQWALFAASGAAGIAGPAGAAGPAGPQGLPGPQGVAGPAGVTGATGPQGAAGVNYAGAYSSATNYAQGDAVGYAGSTWLSLAAGNHGNLPNQSPTQWALLAARGDAGAAGPAGVAGTTGPQGPAGASGPAGPAGAPVTFAGGWSTARAYAVGDAVSYGGSSYIALVANTGREPDGSPMYWGLLAQSGSAGMTGPAGPQGLQGPTGYPGPAGATGVAGPQGAPGPLGPAGAAGPVGPAGPQGIAGAAGAPGIAFQGAYAAGTSYALNDAVTFGGATYLSLAASNRGNPPGSAPGFWTVLAAPGAPGTTGPAGANGNDGAAGIQGPAGPQGVAGPAGAAGANGSPGLVFQGAYSSTANYAVNDAVSYNGGTYLSRLAGNRGNAPDSSAFAWSLLVAAGAAGPAGPAGSAGPQGAAGAAGATGAQGLPGPAGAPGLNFRGSWASGLNYNPADAVTYNGSTYYAQGANSNVQPDTNTQLWTVLAAMGGAGPTGAGGSAATVQVGSVLTGAPGSQASVTNSGTAQAAVLNFLIPQGAPGTGGSGAGGVGGSTSGVPFQTMYHAVSYAATYYSLNNTNQSANETAAVLSWVPAGCTATTLQVFSQQAATITVTLRTGTPGAMADSALSCQVATGQSCTATGSVTIPANGFMDIGIMHPDSNPSGVWFAVACN